MTRRLLLSVFALALFTMACSGSSDSDPNSQLATLDEVGAASGDDALAAPTDTTEAEEVTFDEAQLDFAACMRETYPEWPDPDADAQGTRLGIDQAALEEIGVDFADSEFRELVQQCQADSFDGVAGLTQERTAEEQAELEDELLAVFACVREVPGFEDLPDPDFSSGQGFGIRQLFESGDFDPQEFRTVMQECSTELGIEQLGRGAGGRP